MRHQSSGLAIAPVALALALAGCGGDGIVSDPGTGTRTLAVQASASYESGLQGASFEVRVSKLGQPVSGAKVAVTSGLGMVTLVEGPGPDVRYRGNQAGWPDDGFILDIEVRDATGKLTDSLSASVRVAAPVKLMRPSVTTPFDPHTLAGGVLPVVWSGPAGDRVRVKAKDFEPQPFSPDPLEVSIPAATFDKTEHDLEITRSNTVVLAGGAPDSSFTSDYKLKTTLIVVNPFQ